MLIWVMIILISTYTVASEIPWYQRIIGISNDDIPRFQGVVTYTNCSGNLSCSSTLWYKGEDLSVYDEHGNLVTLTRVGHNLLYIQDDTPSHQHNCTLSISSGVVTVEVYNLDHAGQVLNYVSNKTWFELSNGASATLTTGTYTNPTTNWVYSDENEIVEVSTGAMPTGEKVIWCMINLGNATDNNVVVWDINDNIVSDYEALKDSAIRDWYSRNIWQSGIVQTFTGEELATTSGVVRFGIRAVDYRAKDTTSDTKFIWVNDPDGAFSVHNDLDTINKYETGETIGNNKYFNIMVFGLVNDEHNDYYYITIQDKPTVEYNKLQDAEVDKHRTTDYRLPSPLERAGFRIARIILVHNGNNDNSIQTLTTGANYMDLRDIFIITLGGVGSSAITLDNVLDNDPNTDKNINTTGNITGSILFGNVSCTNITGATSDLCTITDTNINGSPITTNEIWSYTENIKIYGMSIESVYLSWNLSDENNWSDIETYDNSIYDIASGNIYADSVVSDFGAYYPMDENSGDDVYDYSGSNDAVRGNFSNGWVSGKYGYGLEFEGNQNHNTVEAPDSVTFQGTGNFTVTIWVYIHNMDWNDMGIVCGREGNTWIIQQWPNSDKIMWGIHDGGWKYILTPDDIPENTWVHITGIYNGTHVTVWTDGDNPTSNTVDNPRNENNDGLLMGDNSNWRVGSSSDYDGVLDEVYYFKDRVLTASEIHLIMNGTLEGVVDFDYYTDWNIISVVNDAENIDDSVYFETISVEATIPSDANLSIYVNTSSDNSTWDSLVLVNESIISEVVYTLPPASQKRYAQIKIYSISTNASVTPTISNIFFNVNASEPVLPEGISIGYDGDNVIVNTTSADVGITLEDVTIRDGCFEDDIIVNASDHGVRIHAWAGGVNIDPLTENDSIYFGADTPLSAIVANSLIVSQETYDNAVGGINKDVYIDDKGVLGYLTSSKKVKKNIKDASNTDWIYGLQIRDFDYKDKKYGTSQTGMIAEEVNLINPKLISYKRNKTYICYQDIPNDPICNKTYIITDIPETVNYGSPILISSLIREMQLLKERIVYLESLLDVTTTTTTITTTTTTISTTTTIALNMTKNKTK